MLISRTIEISPMPQPSSAWQRSGSRGRPAHELGVRKLRAPHSPGGAGPPPQVHVPARVRLRERSSAPVVAGLSRAGGPWQIRTNAGRTRADASSPSHRFP